MAGLAARGLMCFSSTASFTAAALLLPAGLLGVRLCAAERRPERLPLALCPALFGVQQGLEGLVWLGLGPAMPAALSRGAALAYLFFAHGFWLAWMPWCALRFASVRGRPGDPAVNTAQRLLLLLGLALGLWLWLPLLHEPWRLQPLVVHGNLHYQSDAPLLTLLGAGQASLLYALLISLPLLLTGSARLRIFAVALLLAFLLAWVGYRHAFASTWCFFSAALSPLLLWVLREAAAPVQAPRPPVGP